MRRRDGPWPTLTRGISKDKDFLAARYRALDNATQADGDLVLEQELSLSHSPLAQFADWLLRASEYGKTWLGRVCGALFEFVHQTEDHDGRRRDLARVEQRES